jgi:prophage DNA circulation protein
MAERILEARYTSPSGKEAVFAYETVSRETELKTGVFTFPSRDGAHVQHQGMGARSFPLACVFSGADSMEKADSFEAMLIEPGVGELQHPYGIIKVVPTGNISRRDDLVSGVGESVVTITFTETITDEEAGALDAVAADEIEAQLNEFTDAACADFANSLDTDDISEQLAAQSALLAQTQILSDNLTPLAGADKKTFAGWLTSLNELKSAIKSLYKGAKNASGKIEGVYTKALGIARLTLRIMNLPARMIMNLSSKIQGYSRITADLINQYKNDPFGAEKTANAYAAARLALCGAAASISAGSALLVAESARRAEAIITAMRQVPARQAAARAHRARIQARGRLPAKKR